MHQDIKCTSTRMPSPMAHCASTARRVILRNPPKLGPIRPPPTPLLTPASWLFKILRAFCKEVGSLAKRPAATG